MAAYGSPEYLRVWKCWDLPLGRRICALRASERPTDGNGSGGPPGGWGTPRSAETGHTVGNPERAADRKARLEDQVHGGVAPWGTLTAASKKRSAKFKKGCNPSPAEVAGWGTPRAADADKNMRTPEGARREAGRKSGNNDLGVGVQLAGWPTATASTGGPEPEGKTGRKLGTVAGWPTATAPEKRRGLQRDPEAALRRRAAGHMLNLDDAALLGIVPKGWPTVLVPNGGRSVATAERVGGTYYFGDRKTQVDLAGLVRVVTPAGWTTPAASEPLSPNARPSREATGRTTEYLGRQVHGAMPAGWSTPTARDECAGPTGPRPQDTGKPLRTQVHTAGWPTVVANDDNKSPEAHLAMKERMGGNRKAITSLSVMAKAQRAGWPTVQARDWKDGAYSETDSTPVNSMLGRAVSLSRAKTDDGGVLNPAFACWLMGFPLLFVLVLSVGWETRSSRS